jgi:hypothetical protein
MKSHANRVPISILKILNYVFVIASFVWLILLKILSVEDYVFTSDVIPATNITCYQGWDLNQISKTSKYGLDWFVINGQLFVVMLLIIFALFLTSEFYDDWGYLIHAAVMILCIVISLASVVYIDILAYPNCTSYWFCFTPCNLIITTPTYQFWLLFANCIYCFIWSVLQILLSTSLYFLKSKKEVVQDISITLEQKKPLVKNKNKDRYEDLNETQNEDLNEE